MKKIFMSLIFTLACLSLSAAPLITYDTVTKRVLKFQEKADTTHYQGKDGYILYTVPANEISFPAVPMKYWIVENHAVREMTTEEKTIVDAEIAAEITAMEADKKDLDKTDKLITTLALVLLDETNDTRAWIESFKTAVAASTSLANMQTRVAALPAMPSRTKAQLKTAVVNKYNSL